MKNLRSLVGIAVIVSCYSANTEAEDDAGEQYFNPQFLGQDVASIQDLNFLTQGNELAPGNYFLDLYIGETLIKNINISFNTENNKVVACFTEKDVELLPLNKAIREQMNQAPVNNGCVDIKTIIPEIDYKVDLPKLSLTVLIPQIYLDVTPSGLAKESDWDDGVNALLTNYNFLGTHSYNDTGADSSSYYFNLNNKLNVGAWRLYGNMYWSENKNGNIKNSEFQSNGIYLTRDIRALKSTVLIGQNSLGSNVFDAIQYVGITLASSQEMRPDIENGYTPPIRGVATTRSKITIRQNNLIIYQTIVDPGPYDIKDLYPVGSSGDYEVEVTSLDGVMLEKYNIPYATLPNLLKAKNYNYSATVGRLDFQNADNYEFLQGSFSYGLPFRATVYGGIQGYKDYQALGIGFAKDFGRFGAVSVDMVNADAKFTYDDSQSRGQSYRVLFAKAFIDTKTNIQLTGYRYSTSGYYTLNEAAYKNYNSSQHDLSGYLAGRKRSTFQVNISQGLGNLGQVYVWGASNTYWGETSNSNNIQIGWNKVFQKFNGLNMSLNYNKQKYNNVENNTLGLSLSMPLSSRNSRKTPAYLSNNSMYNQSSGSFSNTSNIYGQAQNNKLQYSIGQTLSDQNSDSVNGNLTYDLNIASLTAGASYTNSNKQINYGVTGSALVHNKAISFFKQAYDTNILVEAKGATGAELIKSGENIKINKQGYALVPYATAYRYNNVEINPETFKDGFDIDNKILKVAPTRGAIAKVTFDVKKGLNFIITPKFNNEKIKFGTIVESLDDHSTSIANDDGTVYITGVKDNSKYKVYWSPSESCEFNVQYNSSFTESIINRTTVICEAKPNE